MPPLEKQIKTCILSFNHPQHTSRCVQSALKHIAPEEIDLIHNGSRDDCIAQLKKEFPQVAHKIIKDNRGYSGGANFALKEAFQAAETSWVYFVTNDTELLSPPTAPTKPGLYAPLIYRRKITQVDSIGGVFYPFNGKLEHIRETSRAEKILSRQEPRHWRVPIRLPWPTPFFYVPGTAFYIDRQTFDQLDGFDETLHTYWEDVDLSARAQKLKITLGIQPETKLLHKVGKTCHKDPFYTNILFKRNRITISQRHTSPWLRPLQKMIL